MNQFFDNAPKVFKSHEPMNRTIYYDSQYGIYYTYVNPYQPHID